MEGQLNLDYYWNAFLRKKWYFIIPAFLVLLTSIVVAVTLPAVYRSSATILIEAQEVPQELVQTTVTGYFEQRLEAITQLVLSRKNLLEIIKQYNPYPEMMERATTEEIVAQMRDDFSLEPIQAQVVNPLSGREATATIAFSLSYEGRWPGIVVRVLNRLVSLYLEENLKQRQAKASTTYDFLEEQLGSLEQEIDETEEKIARYKEQHLRALPELVELNLNTLTRVQNEMDQLRTRLVQVQNNKVFLQGQLAALEHERFIKAVDDEVTTPAEVRLVDLRGRQSELVGVVPDDDPELVALNKKISLLEGSIGSEERLLATNQELARKRASLAEAKEKYTQKHPDVIALSSEVKALEEEILTLSKQMEGGANKQFPRVKEIENPAYINLQTQIKSADLEIVSLQTTLVDLKAKEADYQKRLENSPQVEQVYKGLQRDYAVAQAKYNDTLGRLQSAREAKGMEEDSIAEKLTVIEPPIQPEKPIRPNRMAIVLVGVILSIAVGTALAALAEFLDDSVHSPDALRVFSDQPLLGVVPYLETKKEKRAKRRKRLLFLAAIAASGLLMLLAIHLFYQPLDLLWIRVLNKFS